MAVVDPLHVPGIGFDVGQVEVDNTQPHEDRVRPVPAHRFTAEVAEQAQQQRRMLLFFGHEKFGSVQIFGITCQLRLAPR